MESPNRLFNKNYLLLWQGQFVSKMGNQFFTIAAVLWIKAAFDSATIMGLFGAISGTIAILLGPVGGTIADRYSRKKIILISDLLNGIVVLVLAIAAILSPDNIELILVFLFITSIFNAIIRSFFTTAISASIPDLVPKAKLASANSLGQFSSRISSFFGMGIGGVLFTAIGAPFLFLFNGLTFIFSAISELFIKIPQKSLKNSLYPKGNNFKLDLLDGFKYIWTKKGLRILVFVSALLTFFLSPIMLLLPFFIEDFLHAGDQWYGFIIAVFGIGALLGYFSAAFLRYHGKSRARILIMFIILQGFSFSILAMMRSAILVLIFAFILGIIDGYIQVNITTILQITTPSEMRGRVFGVLSTLGGSLAPISIGLAGVIADLVNQNIPIIYFFCSGAVVILAIIVSLFPEYRKFLEYDTRTKLDIIKQHGILLLEYERQGIKYRQPYL